MTRSIASLGLFLATAVLAAGAQPIDTGKSRIVATFKQMNVPVEGEFKTFSGTVTYDPAQPASASAEIRIDTASFDLGDDDYNAEVRKAEWFDSKAHPEARFASTSVKSLAADRLEASGTLSLKGRTQNLVLPIKVTGKGAARRFDGEFKLSRGAFNIGGADWKDVLEDAVVVRFSIASPAP